MSTITLNLSYDQRIDDLLILKDAYQSLGMLAAESNPRAALPASDVANVLFVLNEVLAALLTNPGGSVQDS